MADLSTELPDQAARAQQERVRWLAAAAILAVVTVLARLQAFGNPVVHIDEQFYLLVGDRMLHGALPYVDIWDRKPVGLFLIFAAIRALGGAGVWQYQIVAAVFAWATAVLVAVMGARISTLNAGLRAGVLYLLALDLAGGQGGQAPVFYNLLIAGAAVLVGSTVLAGAGEGGGRFRLKGVLAMLLVGLAMQVKYTACFEGVAFGLALLWASWRRGAGLLQLAGDALLFIAPAIAPTAAAALAYAALGHLNDFVFANFVSIFRRGVEPSAMVAGRLVKLALILAPIGLGVALSLWREVSASDPAQALGRRLARLWLGAALLGVIAFGGYYIHYALPVLVPASVALAPLMTGRPPARLFGWLLLAGALAGGQVVVRNARLRHGAAVALETTASAMAGGRNCPFVYDGYPAIYQVLGACLPTVRVFPAHQQQATEAFATGVDQVRSVAAIMARHPDRVMTIEPAYDGENPAARAAVYAVLARDYRAVVSVATGKRRIVVYALKPGLAAAPNAAVPGYAPGR